MVTPLFIPLLCALPLQQLPDQIGGMYDRSASVDGAAAGAQFGHSLVLIGDLDFDGVREIAVGAPFEDGAVLGAGAVHVIPGGLGSTNSRFEGASADALFGWAVASAGDLSQDGHNDLLIGAPGADRVSVVDPFASELLSVTGPAGSRFGWDVISVGDVDSDGYDDFAVGAPLDSPGGITEAGSVFLHSGFDGSLIRSFHGSDPGGNFGHSILDLEDSGVGVNGFAGTAPRLLAVGAPGTVAGGHVSVFDPVDGSTVFSQDGTVSSVGSGFGMDLAAMTDADADGIEELAIAAPYWAPTILAFNVGRVETFSVPTGTSLRDLQGEESFDVFGLQIGSGDVDSDGSADLVVRSYKAAYDRIEIFSGTDSQFIASLDGAPVNAGIGIAIDGGADLNLDGYSDLVMGAPLADTAAGANAGKIVVFGFHEVLTSNRTELNSRLGGTLTFQIDFPESQRFKHYVMGVSGSTGPMQQDGVLIPLGNDRTLHRVMRGNPTFPGQQGQLDAFGDARVSFYVPRRVANPLMGTTLYFAVASADGQGLIASSIAVPLDIVGNSGGGN